MNMTDMLLQMTLQNSWQLPQIGQATGTQNQQGSRFQDLLEQRKEDLTQKGGTEAGQDRPEDVNVSNDHTQPDQETMPSTLEAAAASMVPASLVNQLIPAEQENVPMVGLDLVEMPQAEGMTQPMTLLEGQQTPVAQTQTVEAVMPQVAQPQQPVQQEAPVVQPQPLGQETALADQPVVAADTQNTAQETLTQDLTQSKSSQSQNQELEQVVVEHWNTPLFRETETVPVRVGDTAVDMTAPAQEVEKSLANMLKDALSQGEQRVEIKLSPANLGNIVAEFTRTPQGVLHVVLHAETEQTARLLSDHASSLSLMLQDGNRGEVRVEVPQPQQGQQLWQQNQENAQQQQQQQQRQPQHTPRQESETFLHQLRLGLVGMEERAV